MTLDNIRRLAGIAVTEFALWDARMAKAPKKAK